MDYITEIVNFVTGLAPAPLCFLVSWGIGFVLRRSPHVKNEIIPYVIILINAVSYMFVGDILPNGQHPMFHNFLVGACLGVAAWLLHYYRRSLPIINRFFPEKDPVLDEEPKDPQPPGK